MKYQYNPKYTLELNREADKFLDTMKAVPD